MKTYTYPGGVTIKENMTEYLEELKKKPKALEPIIKKHAFAIQANAAKDAPVDTGTLKNSIEAEEIDKNNYEIHDQTDYGVFQELGTSKGVTAKHFLGGAAERQAEPFFDNIAKVLSE